MTTADDIIAVLKPGERISYPTLCKRLVEVGHQPLGMIIAMDDPRFVKRWRTGELYSWMHAYEEKSRGPLFIELAVITDDED